MSEVASRTETILGDAEFFREFAQFEHTIKNNGYYHLAKGDEVRTSWRSFTDEMSKCQDLFDRANSEPHIKYLIENPPEIRIHKGDRLDWRSPPEIKSTSDLIDAVQRIRNNLFHGDKSGPASESSDPERNQKLIRAGRAVLQILSDETLQRTCRRV